MPFSFLSVKLTIMPINELIGIVLYACAAVNTHGLKI